MHDGRRIQLCLAVVGAVLGGEPSASACACIPGLPPFIQSARGAPVVAVVEGERLFGKWKEGVPRYADVKVLRYLKGARAATSLVIEGDNGAQCRHYASFFAPGGTWVVALRLVPNSKSKRATYEVSRCLESVLPLVDGTVTGFISRSADDSGGAPETMSLEALLELLATDTSNP